MKRNPWPYVIVGYFVLFIALMTSWIIFAVRNDHELVRNDYYEHELKFQNELESLNRASKAHVVISHDQKEQNLIVRLPADATGAIHFYRPSNSKLDWKATLAPQNCIDLRDLPPGLWKIHVSWTENGTEYRHDRTLVL